MTDQESPPATTDADRRTLCVYCGSSSGRDPVYAAAAVAVGTAIAEAGHDLVYGGGNVGLMGLVADAVMAAGGSVTGVMTEQLVSAEVAHRQLTTLEILPTMHERKARMIELADGVLVLPGGFGTWEEAMEILTWNQLGLVAMPVVFVDVDGFYGPLFDLVDQTVDAGFVTEANAALVQRADDPTAAVAAACAPPTDFSPKWITPPKL